jgi:hypothetical protein
VEEEEAGGVGRGGHRRCEAGELDEVAVGGIEAMEFDGRGGFTSADASPECGGVRVGEPPRGSIGSGVHRGGGSVQ